jgi:predicted RNase H-like HicB family nuclease
MEREVPNVISYIALLRKESGSDYGVEFPDFPGCVSAGRTLEEAQQQARRALELHLAGMAEDEESVPAPRSLDAIFASDWETRGAVPFLVTVEEREPKAVRVNITLKPSVLRRLDEEAARVRLSRSAMIEHLLQPEKTDRVRAVRKRRTATGKRARGRASR